MKISGLSLPSRDMISQPLGCDKFFGISILARKPSLPLEADRRRLRSRGYNTTRRLYGIPNGTTNPHYLIKRVDDVVHRMDLPLQANSLTHEIERMESAQGSSLHPIAFDNFKTANLLKTIKSNPEKWPHQVSYRKVSIG